MPTEYLLFHLAAHICYGSRTLHSRADREGAMFNFNIFATTATINIIPHICFRYLLAIITLIVTNTLYINPK